MPSITNKEIRHQTVQETGTLMLENGYTVSFDESGALAIKGHGIELFQYPRYLGFIKHNTNPERYQLVDCGWMIDIPAANAFEFQTFTKLDPISPTESYNVSKPYELENPVEFKAAISELKAQAEFDKNEGYTEIKVDIDLVLRLVSTIQNQSNEK
ncbi:hypothetical protein HPY09_19880 (plasmid) [Vibrio cholerae]|uniref:Uncharacterized protein n=1 Tax=Vibrio hepatarius TaxID=171383 RepID=A0A0M0HVF0_9VIBR|nr:MULTISPECIES: hypothetical protein [Vibrio]EJL6462622.1 hypothetical protein [Vibrio cholerae]KOO06040.1 hypothetical protein AKJ31_19045 [Vibrio hepatarius]MBJ6954117.1 hypothetical protein [Vibrio cholerae]MBL4252507.1 hypothetical protein [Vibrio fluvialis]MVC22194.1 hypothetical protein [Vibrio cholerae]